MASVDSASDPVNRPKTAPESFDLGEMKLDPPSDDSGLKSKKWIFSMFLSLVSSIFTGMGIMSIDQWLWFNGALAAGYGILNVGQKKLLQ